MIPVFVALAIYYGESVRRGAPLEWQRFAAIIVFLLAAASDGLDGYVARHYNQRSRLGVILDPIADKGLLLSGIITLSITNWSQSDPDYGKFPVWFPVLVITRDAVILVGAAILHYFIGNKMRVKPSWTGKVATVCQMCAIAWVMLQLRFLPLWFVVMVAGIFTLISGVIYVVGGVRQLQAEGHRVAAFGPRWEGDPHAGRAETAMMLALRPDLVRMDLAAPGNTEPLTELVPALRSGGVRAVSESGVLGDPTGATAAEGLQLLDELAARIAVEIADWRNRP